MAETPLPSSPAKSAQRFRELTKQLAEPLGGLDALNTVEQTMVRSAAALVLRLEQLQEDLAAGENVNPDLLVRLNSEGRRTLTVLRRAKGVRTHSNAADPLTDLKAWADSS